MTRNRRFSFRRARTFPEIGDTFAERYTLLSLLGSGGGSAVFKALDTRLDREIALKILSGDEMDQAGIARFKREAISIARLNHTSIVTIFDFDEFGGQPYLALELVNGQDLWELMYESKTELSVEDGIKICRNILDALQYAHERGVVHRDLKPENVMIINDEFDSRVTDFGLAHIRGQSRITREGVISGSAYYIAPEVANSQPSDHRVDLYALGVMLYELCAFRLPFYAENPLAVIAQHIHETPRPPSQLNPDITPILEAIILKLLSKNPDDRFATAQVVIDALDNLEQSPQLVGFATQQNLIDRITRTTPIGRDSEWTQLRDAWQKVQLQTPDAPPIGMILGSAGSGKTQFANQLMTEAKQADARVLYGYTQNAALPYQNFIYLLRDYLNNYDPELSPMMAADLAKLVPEIAEKYKVATLATLPPDAERLRLYAHITQFLINESEQKPLLLVMDDLHTSDSSTLALLQYLTRQIRGHRIFILGTYRPSQLDHQHPLGELMRELLAQDLVERIVLRRLVQEDIYALTKSIFGAHITPKLAQEIFERTQGNFFFTKELLKSLVVDENIYWDTTDHVWRVRDLESFELPSSIRSIIGQQLSQLEDTTRDTLSVAAIIGREFRFKTLHLALGIDEDDLADILETALDARLIIEKKGIREEAYTFANLAIHQSLIDTLNFRRKARLHLKVAKALEKRYGKVDDHIESIARHYSLGARSDDDIVRAIDHLEQAANRAGKIFALANARELYTIAIELNHESESSDRHAREIRFLSQRAMIHHQLGDFSTAASDFEAALQSPHIEPTRKRAIMLQLGQVYRRLEHFEKAISTLNDAVDLSREIADEPLLADALFHLGSTHWTLSQITTAKTFQEEAYGIVQTLNLQDAVAMRVTHGLAECHGRSVDYDKLFALAEQSFGLAEQFGDLEYQSENLMIIGTARIDRGEYEQAQAIFDENLDLCEKAGLRWHRIANLAVQGMAIASTGDYQRGLNILNEAAESTKGLPQGFLLTLVYYCLGRCYLDLEAFEKADAILSQGLELSQRHGISWSEAGTRALWAMTQIRLGNLEVGAMLQEAVERNTTFGDMRHVSLLYAALTELALARGEYPKALGWATSMGSLAQQYGQQVYHLQAKRLQALAQLGNGDLEVAKDLLESAIEEAVNVHAPRLTWRLHESLTQVYEALQEPTKLAHSQKRVRTVIEALLDNIQEPEIKQSLQIYRGTYQPTTTPALTKTLRFLVIADAFSTMVKNALNDYKDEILRCDAILLLGDLPSKTYPALRDDFALPMPGFCVFGNHDQASWSQWLPRYKFEYIHQTIGTLRVGGQEITFAGFSGSETYNNNSPELQWDDNAAKKALSRLPASDILLSHTIGTPPPGYAYDHVHRGLPAIGDYIEKYQPRLALHGHFHQNYQRKQGATTVLGCYGAVLVQCMITDDIWQIEVQPINKPLWGD